MDLCWISLGAGGHCVRFNGRVFEALEATRQHRQRRELEIPIPPRADDRERPDWSVCQRAWWEVIANVLERSDAPLRTTLEMRVMGGSGITMAPQYGNSLGTCSIEVLTHLETPRKEWGPFLQDVADLWTSFADPDGKPLNVRPHWAKEWEDVRFRGMPAVDYVSRVAYVDRIPEFREGLRGSRSRAATSSRTCAGSTTRCSTRSRRVSGLTHRSKENSARGHRAANPLVIAAFGGQI